MQDLNPPENEKAALQFASWGPQGNQLAFVFDGDIYYQPSVSSRALRLTDSDPSRTCRTDSPTGPTREVLLSYAAHWWSMDGARLAYLTINNTATPVMEIPRFLGGSTPPTCSSPTKGWIQHPVRRPVRDSYISMVTWISSTRLAVRFLNRVQNQSCCVCVRPPPEPAQRTYRCFLQTPRVLLDPPSEAGARGEFLHVAALSAQAAVPSVPPRFLTVDVDGEFERRCLSCNLIDGCRFFSAEFSPNQTHFTLYCRGFVVLEDNGPLSSALQDKRLPETLFRTVSAEHHGTEDPAFVVTEEFSLEWPQVLSGSHGVALAWVGGRSGGGRSGGGRGQKSPNMDPRKLGLLMKLPYIDDRRMVLYG
ncbi:hypothetical protein F7725_001346, partial [Dissostichus mawsoni]